MRKVGNMVCVVLGFICFGLGAVGTVLPVLPTTPFLLAAAFFFAKGSERFNRWFVSTKLYKRYIEQAIKKSMDKKSKRNLLVTLGIIFTIGIIFSPVFAKIIILIVAIIHFYFFLFRVKTVPETADGSDAAKEAADVDSADRAHMPLTEKIPVVEEE